MQQRLTRMSVAAAIYILEGVWQVHVAVWLELLSDMPVIFYINGDIHWEQWPSLVSTDRLVNSPNMK